MASRQWNPAKRLRHLEAVSARNLTLGLGDQQAEAYFSLSFWEEKDSLCCPLYRSEGVCGTLNPEWMPLSWPLDLEPACQAEQVVLAIHQAPAAAAGQGSGELATARFFSQPRPSTTGTKDEATGNSRSLLVGQLTPPESEACDWQGQCRDANLSKQLSSSMDVEPTDPSQHAAAAEPQLDVGLEDDLAPPTAAAPQMSWSTQQRSQEALAFSDEQQDSNGFSFDVVQGNGQYGTGHSGEAHLAQGPASEDHLLEAKGKAASKQLKVVAATPGGPLSGEQGAAAGSAVVVACKALAASRPGAFPGEVIAAWLLDLNRLYFVGGDLASLKEALALDTVVLQLEDGLFVHPPPPEDAAAISLSQTASPTKRALTILASERLPTSSPTGSAPRRFANLLMSKLLRSTRSLQDTADRGGAESDSDHDDAASEASASTRFTSHTASREAAGVLLGGNAAPSASVAPTKALALSDMSLHITALCALRSSVLDLHSRAQALRRRLEELVAVRQQAKEQEQQLWQVQQGAQRSRQRMHRLQHRLGELQQELGGARKAATVRTQALVTTLKVMKAADRKLQDAQESMRGEEGLGRLVGLHSELVARRCLMTCQLGGIFQLGPVTVSVLEAPPGGYLEDRLEQQWVGRGSTQGRQEAPALKLLLPPDFRAWPANGTAALEAESAVHLRQEVHLSIGGIELRSAVWRAAFEDSAGMDITAAEDEAAAVALGYVAQLVDRLAEYLGVQLRYPLCLLGSKSSILEGYPPAGTWSAEEPVKRTLFGRSDASASSSTGTAGGEGSSVEPAEYPLHCQNRRERPKFAVGVFLLNKNITQLLQAHGITAGGPNHLLHNLYKLICAANSGLPQHQQRQQKRG